MAKNAEKKTVKLWSVMIYALAAIIWIINAAAHIIYESPQWLVIMNAACAVVWCAAFAVQLIRYRKGKKTVAE